MLQKRALLPNISEKSLVTKKSTSGICSNMTLMSDLVEWPPLDIFWQVVEDLLSEMYMKSQPSLDEYEPATKRFLAYLFFIVCGLNQDQINVIFYAAIPYCYNTAKKADKIRASKS